MASWKGYFSDLLLENTGSMLYRVWDVFMTLRTIHNISRRRGLAQRSTARDHLANERTYLAWLRTSLSIAAIGIAIQQLLKNTASQVIGYIFVVLAAVFLIVATARYFRMMNLLTQNKFETNRVSVIVISLLCVIAIAAALYALIAT